MNDILIIDYGVGNFQSVANALRFLGYQFLVSGDPRDITQADVYILPGVGAFSEAMKNLESRGIIQVLEKEVLEKKKPLLGICLGMQVLAQDSEEFGYHKGLGWIEGHVVRFAEKEGFTIPHVGWNTISIMKKDPLFTRIEGEPNYYFDHSYYFLCDQKYVLAQCHYITSFASAVQKENIFGLQFHPEKSQTAGLKLFRGFFEYIKNYHL